MTDTNRGCEDCLPTSQWPVDMKYCPTHGKPLESFPKPRCECGAERFSVTQKYCGYCGKKLKEAVTATYSTRRQNGRF